MKQRHGERLGARSFRIGPRLLIPCLILCLSCLGCDMSWEKDAQNAYVKATQQETSKNFDAAREQYEYALQRNPFHGPSNKNLAQLLESHYREDALALEYYKRFLDLNQGNLKDIEFVKNKIWLLTNICEGTIENPEHAVKDLVWAIDHGDNYDAIKNDWIRRIHPSLVSRLASKNLDPESWLSALHKKAVKANSKILAREIVGSTEKTMRAYVFVEYTPKDGKKEFILRLGMRLSDSDIKIWELDSLRPVSR